MIGSRVSSDEQFQGTTEKPFKGYIRDWWFKKIYATADQYLGEIVCGEFVDHPEFAGKRGHTSYVVSKTDIDRYMEIETLNSIYRLNYEDKEPGREFWDMS